MRIRLAVLVIVSLCLMPFLVEEVRRAQEDRADSLAAVEQSLGASVERVQDLLTDVQADIENAAASISISNAYQNTSAELCQKQLLKIKNLYTSVEHISILTPQSIVYCSSAAESHGTEAHSSGKLLKSVHNNDTYWGETQISRVSGSLVIPSATPVRNEVSVDYLIIASVSAHAVLNKALNLFDVPLTEAAIISDQGSVLLSEQFASPESIIGADVIGKSLAVYSKVFAAGLSDQEPYYVGVVKFPMNSSRFVFVASLRGEYERTWSKLRLAVATSLAVTALLALIIMFCVEFFFIRNLRRIGALASEISAGHQGRRISIWSPIADFNALVSALNLMVDKLEDTSRQDALTGIANRRALDAHFVACDQRLAAGSGPIAVAMIDIDNFKPFNDRFGHAAGDETLQRVAKVLQKFAKREGEMAARYGGEEFTLVLNGSDPDRLRAHLDALRRSVENLNIPHPDSPYGHVTVSIGYATAPAGTTLQKAMEQADEALYQAKASGRNRISMAETLQRQAS